jgi:hypothetical protein
MIKRIAVHIIGLFLVGIIFFCSASIWRKPVYTYTSKDLHVMFVVTDRGTGKPVPQASIELTICEPVGEGPDQVITHFSRQVVELITNNEGTANYVHENTWCEEEESMIPFLEKRRRVDLAWGQVAVTAPGYRPVERLSLFACKHNAIGYNHMEDSLREEFSVGLER